MIARTTTNSGIAEQWFGVEFSPVDDGTHHLRLVPPVGTTLDDMQPAPGLPDVAGLSLLAAALAYASAGWFVLPTDPADIKNPGSVVGGSWHEQSSRDPKQIRAWWKTNPGYGIALHVGRSGAIGFDFDGDDLDQITRDGYPEIAKALRQCGAVQGTRRSGDRCHFLFVMPPGQTLGNGAGVFGRWGEVRGSNGVLIAPPTPHPEPDKGGDYNQRATGQLGALPDVLRACVSEAAKHADPKTPAELIAFLSRPECGMENRPHALKGQHTTFADAVGQGESRHETMCAVLVWAFREALVGCYTAQRAYDELGAEFAKVKPEAGPGEFGRIARWAAAQAELADPAETSARLDRHSWPGPGSPQKVAKRVAGQVAGNGRPIVFWHEQWLRWTGVRWAIVGTTAMRTVLYNLLEHAIYKNGNDEWLPWNPDKSKLDKVIDALKSVVPLGDDVQSPSWRKGRDERVIACANGLVCIEDRTLMAHSPHYFNTFALGFDYQPKAATPARWMKFLAEVFPGDVEAAETLQEWFGYVLSGRTDFQKMLMVIGPTRSGKGTVDKVLSALIGSDSHIGLSSNDLKSDFGLQPLLGKSLAVFSDERVSVDGKRFVETLLRIVGEDTVTVHIKYREPWVGQLPTRLMFMSNEPPALPDSSRAVVGRIVPLHMPESFLNREDVGLAKALHGELPGILNWALDGLDRLNDRGHFRIPASGEAIVGLLSEGASPVMQFVDTRCVMGDKETTAVTKDALFAAWKLWCTTNGHEPGANGSLGRKLFAAYSTKIEAVKRGPKGDQRPHYAGIALRPNKRDPIDFAPTTEAGR